MKLYSYDFTWRGVVIVIARDRDHLKELLSVDNPDDFTEYEIKEGLILDFQGDQ